jgi:hypothetical protein
MISIPKSNHVTETDTVAPVGDSRALSESVIASEDEIETTNQKGREEMVSNRIWINDRLCPGCP